jgi:hypothetical protein
VRGKFNNLIHNSMIMLTQRTMHGRRVFDVGRSSSLTSGSHPDVIGTRRGGDKGEGENTGAPVMIFQSLFR